VAIEGYTAYLTGWQVHWLSGRPRIELVQQFVDGDQVTPVRYAVDPWVATVTQGYTAGIEGVSTTHAQLVIPCTVRRLAVCADMIPSGADPLECQREASDGRPGERASAKK
jgi:hypothetical protein